MLDDVFNGLQFSLVSLVDSFPIACNFVEKVVAWPHKAKATIAEVAKTVGDRE